MILGFHNCDTGYEGFTFKGELRCRFRPGDEKINTFEFTIWALDRHIETPIEYLFMYD